MVLLGLALGACATVPTHEIVPANLSETAQVRSIENVRIWGDAGGGAAASFLKAEASILKQKYLDRAKTGTPVSHLLAVSGGADDGAFSAGLLIGWSRRGDRPEFDLVTGVSAGALVAPFAFLGDAYDEQLAGIFVKHGEGDIYKVNVLAGVFGGPSVADNAPLARLIDRYVDTTMLTRIAAERAKGRFLLIGTTNLNAQRPVYWDMGRIAAAGTPEAHRLFRKVLLASAALPGIFPPVHIAVSAGGKNYHETHVDGGPTREVFLSPTDFKFSSIDKLIGKKVQRRLWVIRNGKVEPEYAAVEETALGIASRSLETLTKNQGIGDLIRMHEKARSEDIDYNLAFIPRDFHAPRPVPFDRGYMTALYDRGVAMGKAGYAWAKQPPGIAALN